MICYSARSLALLAPALLLFELLVFLMCVTEGYSRQYWDALKLLKATFPDIRARRRQLQSRSERLGDRVILSGGRISITGRMAGSRFIVRGSGILSAIFGAYWRIVEPFIPGRDDVPKLLYEFPEGSQP